MMNRLLKKTFVLGVVSALGMAAIPSAPAVARNPFSRCVRELVRTGISHDNAGIACSDAIIPKELSRCVVTVRKHIALESEEILKACYQARRPIDLANCAVDINGSAVRPRPPESLDPKTTSFALESCRRSLLPGRHSQCVIALSRNLPSATPIEAMKTCLAAEDFPRDLFPEYVDN